MASEASGAAGGGGVRGVGGDISPNVASPRSRVKFLCSHGGKILPRSVDGLLKYVGGETRVVAVARDINFSELMKKLSSMFEGNMVLKYQLIPDDLESLVSVRTDEDLKHMLEEYDRQEVEGNAKLRAFLFPSNPVILENQATTIDHQAVEQRYIDALNGIVRPSSSYKLPPINASRCSFSISSACSSPKSNSPEGMVVESLPPELMFVDGHQSRLPMHRVQSSPSLSSYSGLVHQSNNGCSHNFHQHPYHVSHSPQPHLHAYQTHRSPSVPLTQSPLPALQTDFARAPPIGHGQQQQHPFYSRCHSTSRSLLGMGSYNKYAYCDEPLYGTRRPHKAGSVPHSPKKSNMQERMGSIDNMDQFCR